MKFNLKIYNFTYQFKINFKLSLTAIILFVISGNSNLFAIELIDDNINRNKQETILKIDTNKVQTEDIIPSSLNEGGMIYSPAQDSAYYRAIRANVTSNVRIWNDLHLTQYTWYEYLKNIKKSDVAIAMESLTSLPKEYYLPDPTEVVQREINIANAFYVPYVNTYNQNGLRVSFADIGSFLGITEDVSTSINYTLEKQSNVIVVVYSLRAVVIATIFDGVQPVGSYSFNWNGRDDNGKKMPPGDYIAEIRISNEKYIRKRILIQ